MSLVVCCVPDALPNSVKHGASLAPTYFVGRVVLKKIQNMKMRRTNWTLCNHPLVYDLVCMSNTWDNFASMVVFRILFQFVTRTKTQQLHVFLGTCIQKRVVVQQFGPSMSFASRFTTMNEFLIRSIGGDHVMQLWNQFMPTRSTKSAPGAAPAGAAPASAPPSQKWEWEQLGATKTWGTCRKLMENVKSSRLANLSNWWKSWFWCWGILFGGIHKRLFVHNHKETYV